MTKAADIENELKDFFGYAIDYLYTIDEKAGQDFLKKANDVFLSDRLKYNKWFLDTPEKDKNVDTCKSIDFLSSEEFKQWPVERKAEAIFKCKDKKNKGGLELRINLADYESLIRNNKTDWPHYLKSLAMILVKGSEFAETDFNLDYLDKNDFTSWSTCDQCIFLKFCADKKYIFKNLDFETLLNHPIFNKISRSARCVLVEMLINRGQKPKEDIDKLDIPSLRKFELLELLDDDGNNKEFKTTNKLFNFNKALEKQMKDMNKKNFTVEEIKKVDGFKSLAPEEKVYVLAKASDLKISDLESIKNIEKITAENAFLIEGREGRSIFSTVFEKIYLIRKCRIKFCFSNKIKTTIFCVFRSF